MIKYYKIIASCLIMQATALNIFTLSGAAPASSQQSAITKEFAQKLEQMRREGLFQTYNHPTKDEALIVTLDNINGSIHISSYIPSTGEVIENWSKANTNFDDILLRKLHQIDPEKIVSYRMDNTKDSIRNGILIGKGILIGAEKKGQEIGWGKDGGKRVYFACEIPFFGQENCYMSYDPATKESKTLEEFIKSVS